ncbi:hypothetical protein SADUNF_Sadunf08G0000700 [Salix dunnii]|uniref:Uncharacterized protein n=1 Tax=Salix dunnii TaxID=1413687 RepID=A0A835JZ30_9ROSI|nr:hypothetical protein SADUNF_Sadunf08G0000700 [Salix dunnii]
MEALSRIGIPSSDNLVFTTDAKENRYRTKKGVKERTISQQNIQPALLKKEADLFRTDDPGTKIDHYQKHCETGKHHVADQEPPQQYFLTLLVESRVKEEGISAVSPESQTLHSWCPGQYFDTLMER